MEKRITLKHIIAVIAVVTAVFAAFMLGIRVGGSDGGVYSISTERGEAFAASAWEAAELQSSTPAVTAAPGLTESEVRININTAAADELTELEGIGPALAERIIAYREENGGFEKLFELMNVPGIGESKYLAIKERITIGE